MHRIYYSYFEYETETCFLPYDRMRSTIVFQSKKKKI